ncbi:MULTISPECIES: response regulator [Sorangium]|uniref:Chemotaxis protein CheY n=1 Tax=Sorangium cellulosum TaxID=56 RepID=A0A4P2QGX2_SORCE|nr:MULTISPECIES: response regulator [Sorangium]AUX29110.1 chemotaxis protein CheY [Sorangium cellulosum]WCQ88501.1 Chemotaxis protein CheY [Sorangium sp. Soce836]
MAKKILLVEDSNTVRQQVGILLSGAGYSIVEADNGRDAVAAVTAHKGDLAMIIADVNMPVMNGIEMLESLRDKGLATGVPILMLTTEGQPELIDKARKAGAKGWIIKPFKPDLLLAAVKKLAGEP